MTIVPLFKAKWKWFNEFMAVEFNPTEHVFAFFEGLVASSRAITIYGGQKKYIITDLREGVALDAQSILFEQFGVDGVLQQRAAIDRRGANHFMDPATASLTNSELELLHQPHERARYALEISANFLADTRRKAA